MEPNYQGFIEQLEEWDKYGICHGLNDLIVLAKKYNTEIPKIEVVNNELKIEFL